VCVYVYVYVCVREREMEGERLCQSPFDGDWDDPGGSSKNPIAIKEGCAAAAAAAAAAARQKYCQDDPIRRHKHRLFCRRRVITIGSFRDGEVPPARQKHRPTRRRLRRRSFS
jgi:hypothetical protein